MAAVCTVLGSTLMALGASGLSLNESGTIYAVAYLIAFISLENVLVITDSVFSTPPHEDPRIRVARGLSREGWNVTRNLLMEITVLTGLFGAGVLVLDDGNAVAVRDFSRLAVAGLLADYFLQSCFFSTVLSVDMARMGLRDVGVKKPTYKVRLRC